MATEVRELSIQIGNNANELRKQWWESAGGGSVDSKMLTAAIHHLECVIQFRAANNPSVPAAVRDFGLARSGASRQKAIRAIENARDPAAVIFLRSEIDVLNALRRLRHAMKTRQGDPQELIRLSLLVGELLPEVCAFQSGYAAKTTLRYLSKRSNAMAAKILTGENLEKARSIAAEERRQGQGNRDLMMRVAARMKRDFNIEVSYKTIERALKSKDSCEFPKAVLARIKGWDTN